MTGGAELPAPPEVVRRAARLGPLPASALPATPSPPGRELVAPWVAATLDRCWEGWGRPDPLVVVEAGAGDGGLAAAVLARRPGFEAALRWLLVDDDPDAALAQRATGLVLEDPALVLGPAMPGPDPDEAPAPPPGIGPVLASLTDLPAGLAGAVVLAVGWLGRLPADRFEWRAGRWWEVRLAAGTDADRLVELLVDAGGRGPGGTGTSESEQRVVPVAARRWVAAARRVATTGIVLAVDGPPYSAAGAATGIRLARLAPGGVELGAVPGPFPQPLAVQWVME